MSGIIIQVCLGTINFDVRVMYDTIFKSVNSKLNTLIKRIKLFHDVINVLYFRWDQVSPTYLIKNLVKPGLISLSTTKLSNSVIITLAKTGPCDKPIDTPSICL